MMVLPEIEQYQQKCTRPGWNQKKAIGTFSRKSVGGEALMVPYEQLSEKVKEPDRNTVKVVDAAITKLQSEA